MELDLKTEAETLRQLLHGGLVDRHHVRAWADTHVEGLATPPDWLLDVSMARDDATALSALHAAPGHPNVTTVRVAQMQAYLKLLEREPERLSEIAKALYFIGVEDETPALDGHLMSFWDSVDLAREGIFGSVSEERARLIEFLRSNSTRSAP